MLIIIDGHSLAYKIFYKTPMLYNSQKIPTSTVHSFLNTLLSIRDKFHPDRLVVVFDSKGKTERHDLMEDYKANRQATPPDLITQVEYLKQIIPLIGFELYAKEGIEADDLIYTIAQNNSSETYIVTKDKDIAQLVSDNVKILDYTSNELLDREKIYDKYLVYPEQIVDFLALCGDSSDNIPGVKGVGEKTAVALLKEFGNLDNIYQNLDKIKPSWRIKLENDKELAYLSRDLAKLRLIDNLDSCRVYSEKDLRVVLKELELKSIESRVFKEDNVQLIFSKVEKSSMAFTIGGKFYITDGKNIELIDNNYNLSVEYIFNLKEFVKNKFKLPDRVFDLEILSWMTDPDSGVINLSENDTVESFAKKIISKKDLVIDLMNRYNMWELYWNIEYKIIYLIADMELNGIKLDPIKLKEVDCKIRNLMENEKNHIDNLIGEEININSPKQLSKIIFEKLKMQPFKKTKTGYSTDEESLRNMIVINQDHEELLRSILRHREYSKLVSTYTSKLSDFINPLTNRIHSQFKQTGTATGRLSSNNPNLQNIPQKGELGSEIRSSFISEDGYSFLSFDYSQIELRILAHISDDENLKNAFFNNLDIHNITAMNVLGITEDQITKDIRRIAKAVNFGIVYGLSPYGLSRDLQIPLSDSKRFIDKYFKTYPLVKKYMSDIVAYAQENGYVETIAGRKRFISDINNSNGTMRQRAERIAINSPIQGSAADIIKMAMIKSFDYIKQTELDAKIILQIHDELVFEVNDKDIDKASKNIKLIMENVWKLKVPLQVSCYISKNLGELK
ncbi:MAG: DNA polymerase I [Calditerrivibrio sp.]|nr:DNA polymerase I [Calditerrivibrio sp.]MCA1932117.1 DNA polymerase I [Calditerrivibrio sp.]